MLRTEQFVNWFLTSEETDLAPQQLITERSNVEVILLLLSLAWRCFKLLYLVDYTSSVKVAERSPFLSCSLS